MKLLCLAAMAGLAAAALSTPAARAADPEFCRDYARAAVEQSERAMNTRGCGHLLHDGRFSTDFRTHFQWCLEAHRHEADEQRSIRHEELERCAFRDRPGWDR